MSGAVLTGVTVGLALHYTGDALSQLLRLPSSSSEPPPTDLIDLKEPQLDWETKWRDNYQSSTILEEEENSQSSDDFKD